MEDLTCNGHMFLLENIMSRTLTGVDDVDIVGSIMEDDVNNDSNDSNLI